MIMSKGATTVLKLGGPSAVGPSRVEALKAPRGVGCGVWGGVSPSPHPRLITRHLLVTAKGEVLVLLCFWCLFFVNDFSTTREPIQAKFCMRVYSGSGCVFSPFGVSGPRGRKRGKWNFRYYRSQWGIFAFLWFLSDISATRGRIHAEFYMCRDNVCWRAPSISGLKGKGKGKCIYIARFCSTSHSRRSGMDHTVLPAITPMPALVSVHQMAPPQTEVAHI